jgi:hypothetical protein
VLFVNPVGYTHASLSRPSDIGSPERERLSWLWRCWDRSAESMRDVLAAGLVDCTEEGHGFPSETQALQ